MRGLDPRIHREECFSKAMDCRVKPGNDGWSYNPAPHCRAVCKIQSR